MKGWEMVSPAYKSLILLAFNVPSQPSPSLYKSEPQSWEVEIMRGKVSQCQGLLQSSYILPLETLSMSL